MTGRVAVIAAALILALLIGEMFTGLSSGRSGDEMGGQNAHVDVVSHTRMSPQVGAASSAVGAGEVSAQKPGDVSPSHAGAPYWKKAFSIGFANYVSQALRVDDPELALNAYRLMQSCEGVDSEAAALEVKLQSTSSQSPQHPFVLAELKARQAEVRQCQGISAEMHSNERALLERAARGSVPGAASIYLRTYTAPEPLRTSDVWLVQMLTTDAMRGDLVAIHDLACDTRRQLASEEERKVYLSALRWATKNSPESDRAQRWLDACPPYEAGAAQVPIGEVLQANIVRAARRRLSGE